MAEPQAIEISATALAATSALGDLEAEADNWEGDSAVGEEDIALSTSSIGSSIMKYRQENGRTYHAYKVINSLASSNLARH